MPEGSGPQVAGARLAIMVETSGSPSLTRRATLDPIVPASVQDRAPFSAASSPLHPEGSPSLRRWGRRDFGERPAARSTNDDAAVTSIRVLS
ncbi:MAG: hypothetical protein JRN59_03365 [Nitrososphaerota archaeon]|nr:hypothetical protein [Nitrososphaerota archaeon]